MEPSVPSPGTCDDAMSPTSSSSRGASGRSRTKGPPFANASHPLRGLDAGRTVGRASSALCVAIAALIVARDGALAYDSGPRAYLNAEACKTAHALSDAECQTAYANAKAEFDEKAPRFLARSECERYFRRCMIDDIAGRHVTFVPQMRGFRVDSGRRREVVPVTEGGDAGPLFQPRPVDRADAFVSNARKAEAERTWKAMISPPPAGAPAASAESRPAVDQAVEHAGSGEPQSFPVPPAMLQDLQARERLFGGDSKPQ